MIGRAARAQADLGFHVQYAQLLLQLFRTGDRDLFQASQGSFSAAIFDRAAGRLTLLNDRFGTRPLYYARPPGRRLFASSINALAADPALSREPSPAGMAQFCWFFMQFFL